MNLFKFILSLPVFCFSINVSAQVHLTKGRLSALNGTYRGVQYSEKFGYDTSCYRIFFLNGSTFAFSNFALHFRPKEKVGSFNYSLFIGVARLLNVNGIMNWWGLIDSRQTMVDFDNPTFLDPRPTPTLTETFKGKLPAGDKVILEFRFLDHKMDMVPSKFHSMHMQSGLDSSRYEKLDDSILEFTVNKRNYNRKVSGLPLASTMLEM